MIGRQDENGGIGPWSTFVKRRNKGGWNHGETNQVETNPTN